MCLLSTHNQSDIGPGLSPKRTAAVITYTIESVINHRGFEAEGQFLAINSSLLYFVPFSTHFAAFTSTVLASWLLLIAWLISRVVRILIRFKSSGPVVAIMALSGCE